MKRWLVGVLVLAVAYAAASPLLTVYYMKSAAEARDGEALSEYVDFPAVRQDLKDQLNVKLGREMAKEADDNALAVLGGMLAGVMVNKMVDTFVTPTALIELMKGEVPKASGGGRKESEATRKRPFGNASFRYEAWDRFSVIVPNRKGEETRFTLRRRGIGWKLAGIKLPMGD